MGGSTGVDTGQLMKAATMVGLGGGNALGNGHFENWGDSGLADNSQQTDTSTDVDTDDKNQVPSLVFFHPSLCFLSCHFLINQILNWGVLSIIFSLGFAYVPC